MKALNITALIAGILLGLLFIIFGSNFFLKFIPIPPAEEGSKAAMFMGALYTSGALSIIKVLQVIGGILVAIPKTRNIGLLILAPIIINILGYNALIAGKSLFQPPLLIIMICPLILLVREWKAFSGLVTRS